MLAKFRDKILFKLCDLTDFIFIQIFFKFVLLLRGTKVPFSAKISKFLINWPHQLSIGQNCVFENNLVFKYDSIWRKGPNIIIGDNVFIGRNTEFNISERISIGHDCLIASNCVFIDHDHGFSDKNNPIRLQGSKVSPITIEDNVWIGTSCIILKGVTIGSGSIIGAGSVVTKNVPPHEIWCGSSASRKRKRV
jgi:acetyltransferase-like isoleucine patch superfamily enzyme